MHALDRYFREHGGELSEADTSSFLERATETVPGLRDFEPRPIVMRAKLPFYTAVTKFDGDRFSSDVTIYLVTKRAGRERVKSVPESTALVESPLGFYALDLRADSIWALNQGLQLRLPRAEVPAYARFFVAFTVPRTTCWSLIEDINDLSSLVPQDWLSQLRGEGEFAAPYVVEVKESFSKNGSGDIPATVNYLLNCYMIIGGDLLQCRMSIDKFGFVESIDRVAEIAADLPRTFEQLKENDFPGSIKTTRGTYRRLRNLKPVRIEGGWAYLPNDQKRSLNNRLSQHCNVGSMIGDRWLYRMKTLSFATDLTLLQITDLDPASSDAPLHFLFNSNSILQIDTDTMDGFSRYQPGHGIESYLEQFGIAVTRDNAAQFIEFWFWLCRTLLIHEHHFLSRGEDVVAPASAQLLQAPDVIEQIDAIDLEIAASPEDPGAGSPRLGDSSMEDDDDGSRREWAGRPALSCHIWYQDKSTLARQQIELTSGGLLTRDEPVTTVSMSQD